LGEWDDKDKQEEINWFMHECSDKFELELTRQKLNPRQNAKLFHKEPLINAHTKVSSRQTECKFCTSTVGNGENR
jgi:hypothetical protein